MTRSSGSINFEDLKSIFELAEDAERQTEAHGRRAVLLFVIAVSASAVIATGWATGELDSRFSLLGLAISMLAIIVTLPYELARYRQEGRAYRRVMSVLQETLSIADREELSALEWTEVELRMSRLGLSAGGVLGILASSSSTRESRREGFEKAARTQNLAAERSLREALIAVVGSERVRSVQEEGDGGVDVIVNLGSTEHLFELKLVGVPRDAIDEARSAQSQLEQFISQPTPDGSARRVGCIVIVLYGRAARDEKYVKSWLKEAGIEDRSLRLAVLTESALKTLPPESLERVLFPHRA